MTPRSVRVFPRRTTATPVDANAVVGFPGIFDCDVEEARISTAFTYDIPAAERLAEAWGAVASKVTIGGPAYGLPSGEFVPGEFVKPGYVITSRGCPNRCWFCSVWKREGPVRELLIRDGHNILDDNLLACSEAHIRSVFTMLKRQSEPAQFTGGLEAKRLRGWHVDLLSSTRVGQLFLAYDEETDYEPLVSAAKMLGEIYPRGSHKVRAYVLCGYPKDTFDAAEQRMRKTVEAGVFPMAMLWRGADGKTSSPWRVFQREWARPHLVGAKIAALAGKAPHDPA
jgi:hypothetical protein